MCAKLSVLPQRNKTNAQMSERDTLAKYCERLTLVGLQLSALRLRLRRSCGGARGCGAVRIPRRQDDYTPQPRVSKFVYSSLYYWFLLPHPSKHLELKKDFKKYMWPWHGGLQN
jgi:hypothetical protein